MYPSIIPFNNCKQYIALIFFLTWFSLPLTTFGQGETQPTDSIAIPEIKPFNIANLSEELEKTTIFLNSIEAHLKLDEKELSIDSLMPGTINELNKLYEDPRVKKVEDMNYRELSILRKAFVRIRNLLEQWRDALKSISQDIEPLLNELSENKAQWVITNKAIKEQELPPASKRRIERLLKDTDHYESLIRKRNGELLIKQNKLTENIIKIHETLKDIDKILKTSEGKLFTIDSQALWTHIISPSDSTSLASNLEYALQQQKEVFKEFWKYYSYNFRIHLIFTIILLILLFVFKRHVKKWSEEKLDDSLNASLYIIYHPAASGLLISMLFSGIFYPNSIAFQEHMRYLTLLPLMIILPGLVPDIKKYFLYVFVILVLLIRISELLSGLVLLTRLIYLAVDIMAIITIWPIVKPKSKMRDFRSGNWWEFGLFIIKLSFIGFVISVFSNLIGNVVLTRFLTSGGVNLIFWGVVMYVVDRVLESLIALIMQTKMAGHTALVREYPDDLKKHSIRLIRIITFLSWLSISAKELLIYNPVIDWTSDFLTQSLSLGTLNISLGNILSFFIALWVAFTAARFVRFLLQEEILVHFDMPRGVPGAIGMITRLIIITFGFVVAFGVAGIDFSNIAIIAGALGVGIGFGLQNIFNNLVSGLILAFERPIQVGDIIQIASLNLMGEVKEIGFRASIIRTFDGAEVVVPNGNFVSSEMINWTLSDKRRRQEILVGVEYGSDLKKVLEVLTNTVTGHENVIRNPGPLIIFTGFGDSSLDFRVLFWTHFQVGLTTRSAVGIAIDEALQKAGITIPFQQTDLHVRSMDEEVKEVLNGEKTVAPKATRAKSTTVKKKPGTGRSRKST